MKAKHLPPLTHSGHDLVLKDPWLHDGMFDCFLCNISSHNPWLNHWKPVALEDCSDCSEFSACSGSVDGISGWIWRSFFTSPGFSWISREGTLANSFFTKRLTSFFEVALALAAASPPEVASPASLSILRETALDSIEMLIKFMVRLASAPPFGKAKESDRPEHLDKLCWHDGTSMSTSAGAT